MHRIIIHTMPLQFATQLTRKLLIAASQREALCSGVPLTIAYTTLLVISRPKTNYKYSLVLVLFCFSQKTKVLGQKLCLGDNNRKRCRWMHARLMSFYRWRQRRCAQRFIKRLALLERLGPFHFHETSLSPRSHVDFLLLHRSLGRVAEYADDGAEVLGFTDVEFR